MPEKTDRAERLFRRRQRSERATAAVSDVVERRVRLLSGELELAQIEAIPKSGRGSDWDDVHGQKELAVKREKAQIAALERHAEELSGKPPTAKEKRERRRAVEQAHESLARNLADSWEDSLAGHVRNLAVLEGTPEELREEDHEAQVERQNEDIANVKRALAVLDQRFPDVREPEPT